MSTDLFEMMSLQVDYQVASKQVDGDRPSVKANLIEVPSHWWEIIKRDSKTIKYQATVIMSVNTHKKALLHQIRMAIASLSLRLYQIWC